jgi:arylamine N-acetyltransferase
MINIVTIAGQRYFADVGFGSSGPHHPIPLKESYSTRNVGTQSLRLVRSPPPDLLTSASASASVDQALWTYQYRHTDELDWLPAYCFGETEFTPSDFAMMNWFMSTSRTSWFTYRVVCMKMVMSEEEEELIGDVTLIGGEVKRRIGGTSMTLAVLESEAQRVEALREHLGVKLSVEERSGIRGMVSELA